jgi:hypothetical protein
MSEIPSVRPKSMLETSGIVIGTTKKIFKLTLIVELFYYQGRLFQTRKKYIGTAYKVKACICPSLEKRGTGCYDVLFSLS